MQVVEPVRRVKAVEKVTESYRAGLVECGISPERALTISKRAALTFSSMLASETVLPPQE